MDYWRRVARISRLERVGNEEIGKRMNVSKKCAAEGGGKET